MDPAQMFMVKTYEAKLVSHIHLNGVVQGDGPALRLFVTLRVGRRA